MGTGHSNLALTESFWGRVKSEDPGLGGMVYEEQVEAVRQRILGALLRAGLSGHSKLIERVILAPELMDLWYLRSDVMHTISQQQGEAEAGRRLAEISRFFIGMLPPGLSHACFYKSRDASNANVQPIRVKLPAPESIMLVAMRHASALHAGLQAA